MEKIKWFFRVIWEFIFPEKYNKNSLYNPCYTDSIMSFNIRRDVVTDGSNNWKFRKYSIIDMISSELPTVLCMQECMPHMWKFMKKNTAVKFKGFYTDAFTKIVSLIPFSEGLGIIYSKDYSCINKGYIKLSNKFGLATKHWRICQYIKLFNKYTGQEFWVFNTHLDHKDKQSRVEACKIIHNFIQTNCKNETVFICGDFNEEINNDWSLHTLANYKNFQIYTEGTYNGYGKSNKCIDFIFNNYPNKYYTRIIDKSYDYGVDYLSDHNPIMITL